jgi:mono/diheme cytochrome c family protein
MKRWGLFLFLVLVVLTACQRNGTVNSGTTTPTASATATPDEFASIRGVYAKECVECHGANGTGGLVKVEGKQLKVPSFKEGHALKHSDEDFVDQIKDGGDGMPKFRNKLTEAEIELLVRFIRKEFQGK